jgi:Protein of unknown function (DUF429)
MNYFIGFDPGGNGRFGWAVAASENGAIPHVIDAGLGCHAQECVERAVAAVPAQGAIAGAGIDSPIYWTPSGIRVADRRVREAVRVAGAPAPGGTVQHPNALRGACVVQGPTAAMLLRRTLPTIPITEAHPKAMLWCMSPTPMIGDRAGGIGSEHERDAALGALTAWAMFTHAAGWSDLRASESDTLPLVSEPVGYWFPLAAG